MKIGNHGEDFKYLPLSRIGSSEYYPRILPIAGVYPTTTIEEIMAPIASPSPLKG